MFYSLLFLLTLSTPILLADSIPIQQVMTEDEIKKIGLDSATPEQRQAFENWIGSWTHRVVEQAPSYRPGTNISLWIQSWPSYANPTKTKLSKEDIDARLKANQRIDKVKNEGAIIELRDGSIWAVSPLYTYLTKDWLKNHVVKVDRSENVMFTYRLTNINNGQIAEANMKQAPSPTGQKAPDNPEEFKGALGLENVTTDGENVTLANGSQWKIAPVDMYKARTWKEHDRIKVEKADNFLYKYRLTNLDNGQTVLANQG